MGLTFVDTKPEAAPQEREPERWKTRWLTKAAINSQCVTCGLLRNVDAGDEFLAPHCHDFGSKEEAEREAENTLQFYHGTARYDVRFLGALRVD